MNRRELFGFLSRKPERRWPDGFLHHGSRLLLLFLLAGAVSALFPVSPLPEAPPVERGGVLEEDVVAEVPFSVYMTPAELERERQDAAASVNPIFVYDSTAVDSMRADVEDFFARVDSAATAPGGEQAAAAVRDLLEAYALPASADEVGIMLDPRTRRMLRSTVRDVILDELPRGIARRGELEEAGQGRIRILGTTREQVVPTDSVLQLTDFYDRSRFHVPTTAPRGYEQLQRLILVRFNVPSIRPNRGATEAARELARAAVDSVKTRFMRGQRIVPAREPVTEEDLQRFRAYQQTLAQLNQEAGRSSGIRAVGAFLFNLITLSLLGVLLYFYRPALYRDARHLTVLAGLVLALVALAAVIARYGI